MGGIADRSLVEPSVIHAIEPTMSSGRDYTSHQRGIIKRYYQNFDTIKRQRLAELTTDLYLAEGAKRERLWKQVEQILTAIEFPESRIQHLMREKNVTALAQILQELGN